MKYGWDVIDPCSAGAGDGLGVALVMDGNDFAGPTGEKLGVKEVESEVSIDDEGEDNTGDDVSKEDSLNVKASTSGRNVGNDWGSD